MKHWSEIDTKLKRLTKYRKLKEWSFYFNSIEEIRTIDNAISNSSDLSKSELEHNKSRIKKIISDLDDEETKYMRKTSKGDDKGYTAVYEVIGMLLDVFVFEGKRLTAEEEKFFDENIDSAIDTMKFIELMNEVEYKIEVEEKLNKIRAGEILEKPFALRYSIQRLYKFGKQQST